MGAEFKGLKIRLVEPSASGRITNDGGSLVSAAAMDNDANANPATPDRTAFAHRFITHWTPNCAGCSGRTSGANMAGLPAKGRIVPANPTAGLWDPFDGQILFGKIAHLAVQLDFIAGQLARVFNPDVLVAEFERFDKGDGIRVDFALGDG